MIFLRVVIIFILSTLFACNKVEKKNEQDDSTIKSKVAVHDSVIQSPDTVKAIDQKKSFVSVPDTDFVVMNNYARNFVYDMKYATADNFLKKAVYACDQCLVRKEVADALQEVNDFLANRGLRIKFYDCYRPLEVQKQMWKIYPDSRYVGNPNTTGSVHNKGCAVDISLVDLEGKELDMGTAFDHFGKESHHAYSNLPDTVLSNRKLLKETMEAHGFGSITSEWWHYNFKSAKKYSLSNFSVKCDREKSKESIDSNL
jgi:D-alanyl-D-alanine dipeptidase